MLAQAAIAQNPVPAEAEYPYRRDIEKGKYDKAAEKILRHISRDNQSLECHYAAYQIFAIPAYSGHNNDSAYSHLVRVKSIYANADPKYIERWDRDSYSPALFDYGLHKVCRQALHQADSIGTPDALQHFLAYYTMASDSLRDAATALRDTLEFVNAQKAGTLDMMQDFIIRRPSSLLVGRAIVIRDSIAFDAANQQHTTSAFDLFRTAYPRSQFYARATDSMYAVEYRNVRQLDAEQYYRSYALRFPQSQYAQRVIWLADSIEYHREVDTARWQSYIHYLDRHTSSAWQDTAMLHLTHYALRQHSIQAASAAATRLTPGSVNQQRIGYFLHQAYLGTSIRHFDQFYTLFPNLMSHQQYQHDSVAFELNNNYHYHISDSCIRAIAPCREAMVMLQQLLKDDIDHNRFAKALATVNLYADYFGDDYSFLQLKATLTSETMHGARVDALPSTVNTAKGDEFAPVLSADGRTLFFAGKNRTDNIGGTDVFAAHRSAKGWSNASLVMDLSHTYGNEIPATLSPDGNTITLYQSGLLSQGIRTADGWSVGRPQLPLSVLRSIDAQLCANGQVIIFAALGKTEREIDTSINLYFSVIDTDGNWSQPQELGPTINTPFDERSPYLHPDMKTLYFASEGHGALGQMDIFMCRRLDDTFTHWSQPVNIGSGINTSDNDYGMMVTTDGETAIYAKRDASMNIYSAKLHELVRPEKVALITGTVTDNDGNAVNANLCFEDPATGAVKSRCTTANGNFTMVLPLGQSYGVYVNHPDYYPTSQKIELYDDNAIPSLTIKTSPYPTASGEPVMFTLNSISFDVASKNFTSESQAELLRLAHIIKDHNYLVEIGCHVDGNAGDAENLALTQLRANTIRDFLIEHGCRPSAISARGYGSDRPLVLSNKISSKTARPQSRRVEVTLTLP